MPSSSSCSGSLCSDRARASSSPPNQPAAPHCALGHKKGAAPCPVSLSLYHLLPLAPVLFPELPLLPPLASARRRRRELPRPDRRPRRGPPHPPLPSRPGNRAGKPGADARVLAFFNHGRAPPSLIRSSPATPAAVTCPHGARVSTASLLALFPAPPLPLSPSIDAVVTTAVAAVTVLTAPVWAGREAGTLWSVTGLVPGLGRPGGRQPLA